MNSKINRIDTEIAKTKQKISGLQAHIRELEQQKTELENTDIVGLVRGSGMFYNREKWRKRCWQ